MEHLYSPSSIPSALNSTSLQLVGVVMFYPATNNEHLFNISTFIINGNLY